MATARRLRDPGAALARTGWVLTALAALAGALAAADFLVAAWRASQASGSWDDAVLLGTGTALLVAALALAVCGVTLRAAGLRRSRTTPATFLREDEEERVLAAMREFERRTSGEIRVHLAARITRDIMEEARTAFEKLGMTATAERNGVLFFVAVAERRFAVLGDRGIHAQVAPDFWDGVAAAVAERFARGRFADGLCEGIALAGESLAALFPRRPDDRNELPDRISREGDVP